MKIPQQNPGTNNIIDFGEKHASFRNPNFHFEASSRVRKGQVGGYINYLSKNEIEKLFTIANRLLTPQSQALLKANDIDVHMSDMESGLIT